MCYFIAEHIKQQPSKIIICLSTGLPIVTPEASHQAIARSHTRGLSRVESTPTLISSDQQMLDRRLETLDLML